MSEQAQLEARRTSLYQQLLREVLGDAHRYAPGVEQRLPTRIAAASGPLPRRAARSGREHLRDLIERTAARAGFSRRHFDPRVAAEHLTRIAELSEGFDCTLDLLADEASKRALLDLLKLRVLGPYHAPLRTTSAAYRAKQAEVDRELRLESATFEVSDPWFSPLSLYRVPVPGGPPVTLHSHSVDVVSVFLLHQYSYGQDGRRVGVGPGDVVLDVGGCWGDTALYFASLVGPTGKVYTFEFDPESLAILRANLSLNPELARRIEVVEQALWDTSGESLGIIQAGRMTHVQSDGTTSGLTVPTVTIDDFVDRTELEQLDFVKMDVEGVEMNVLRGATRALAELRPRLGIAAYHRDDDLVQIPELIDSLGLGYRFFLNTYSAVEEETVLFATAANSST
ncbi:MAG TPA: FkbM family methyltransferase [Thermoleophilaceae bacterium]